jgi:hypothetical protein
MEPLCVVFAINSWANKVYRLDSKSYIENEYELILIFSIKPYIGLMKENRASHK